MDAITKTLRADDLIIYEESTAGCGLDSGMGNSQPHSGVEVRRTTLIEDAAARGADGPSINHLRSLLNLAADIDLDHVDQLS